MSEFEIQYNSRNLLEAMKLNPLPTSFLKDLVVTQTTTHDTEYLQIDRVIGGQTKASYTARDAGPNLVAKSGYSSKLHVAPYAYEEIVLTPKDVDVRLAGVDEFSSNASEVLDQRVAGYLRELNGRFDRLEEQQIAEALQSGEIEIPAAGGDYTIDFGMAAANLPDVSATAPWSTTSTDILSQLTTWQNVVIDGGGRPLMNCVMGQTAAKGFLANTAILANLDRRRVERGEINVRQVYAQRASYIGTLAGPGYDIDFWTYAGGYDVSGTFTRFVNDKKVIFVGGSADLRMHYGKIENFNSSFIGERFPNTVRDPYGKKISLTMESSPLFGMHEVESVLTATVIA